MVKFVFVSSAAPSLREELSFTTVVGFSGEAVVAGAGEFAVAAVPEIRGTSVAVSFSGDAMDSLFEVSVVW